jgi:hypothetical protein
MTKLPQTIKFNTLDRVFLIPETDDPQGMYFPMSLAAAVLLKSPPRSDDMIRAVKAVERKFPQFRLGYKLDFLHTCWRRVSAEQLEAYLASLVITGPADVPLERQISTAIRTNIVPLEQPIQIILAGQAIIVRQHHSFGDGKFLFRLLQQLLLALYDPDTFEKLPDLPMRWTIPLWRVIAQSPRQTARVLSGWIKSFTSSYQEFQHDMAAPTAERLLDPIRSNAEMHVCLKTIRPEILSKINELRTTSAGTKLSLNTALQVIIAHRLIELGLMEPTIPYTIPVDLHRYLNDPGAFYAGNLASQIRLSTTKREKLDLVADCLEIQQRVDEQLANYGPLLYAPSEILLALNDGMYKKVNRGWLLNSTNTDPRFFVLSNLGNFDAEYGLLAPWVDLAKGIYLGIPLMGAPHLVVAFTSTVGQGNLTLVYDPRVMSTEQINTLLQVFDTPEWLMQKFGN